MDSRTDNHGDWDPRILKPVEFATDVYHTVRDWISDNLKTLIVLIITHIGFGVLGYLTFADMGTFHNISVIFTLSSLIVAGICAGILMTIGWLVYKDNRDGE